MFSSAALLGEPQLATKHVLSLNAAKRIAEAAEEDALKRGSTVVIAVVDNEGHLLVLERISGGFRR